MTLSPTQLSELSGLCGPAAADAIARLVVEAPDAALNRINPISFGLQTGIPESDSIGAFLHATRLGIFDLSWNIVCPSCGGVLNASESLKTVNRHRYDCTFCSVSCEPNLDDIVEITFTVNPNVREIAAHAPNDLPVEEYLRQAYWSSGIALPEDMAGALRAASIFVEDLQPGATRERGAVLPEGTYILFDPVSHDAQHIKVAGAAHAKIQTLAFTMGHDAVPREAVTLHPGPLTITLENATGGRTMPVLWIMGTALTDIVSRHRPYLSAKRLLTHQTFRDLYRTDTLETGQRFKITSLTFMFTDLKGSTELYERVGDLTAYDLVREHFRALAAIVGEESGAIVKTIGDAIMATFPAPEQALTAALRMRDAMADLNRRHGKDDLILKIGLHEGPCLAVTLNDQQDYFGQTVNIAARIQGLANADTIFVSAPVGERDSIKAMIAAHGRSVSGRQANLKGIQQGVTVYEIT